MNREGGSVAPIHCVKSVCIRSLSGLYLPAFGLQNPEYGHFSRSDTAHTNLKDAGDVIAKSCDFGKTL